MKEYQGLYYDQPSQTEMLAREALKKLSGKDYTLEDLREAEKEAVKQEYLKRKKVKEEFWKIFIQDINPDGLSLKEVEQQIKEEIKKLASELDHIKYIHNLSDSEVLSKVERREISIEYDELVEEIQARKKQLASLEAYQRNINQEDDDLELLFQAWDKIDDEYDKKEKFRKN